MEPEMPGEAPVRDEPEPSLPPATRRRRRLRVPPVSSGPAPSLAPATRRRPGLRREASDADADRWTSGPAGGEVTSHAGRRRSRDVGCQTEAQPQEPRPILKRKRQISSAVPRLEDKGPSSTLTELGSKEPSLRGLYNPDTQEKLNDVFLRAQAELEIIKAETKKAKWIVASAGECSSSLPAVPLKVQRPLQPRYPPFPTGCSGEAVEEWILNCSAILELAEEEPLNYPPIFAKPKDLQTAKAVTSLTDQRMLLSAGASAVSVSSVAPDGSSVHYTGFIFADSDSKDARILTCSDAVCDHEGKLRDGHKLLVRLPNEESMEGHLLFYNHYYRIALFKISVDKPLPYHRFASSLLYGDEVFILSRDEESFLMTRSSNISCSAQPYLDCNCYLYLDVQLPKCGSGGLVIDRDGNFAGMSLELGCQKPAVLTSSIILKCIEMERRFRRIARPILGMSLTTVELLDFSKKDKLIHCYDIDSGYVVNEVSVNSDAERFGIRRGDVITSFDGMSSPTLPELEEHLLSLGGEFLGLDSSRFRAVLTIQFCDLQGYCGRSIDLPVGFTCSRAGINGDHGGSEQDVKDATSGDL